MSELPKGWESKQLKELFSFVLGGDWGKDPEYSDADFETVYCIRGTEFRNWRKEKGLTSVERKVKSSSVEKRKLQEGDILIEISGGGPDQPVGRTILIDEQALNVHENMPLVCTNFIRLARPQDSVSSRYLNYYLQSFYLSGEVTKYQGGSNNLRNLKFKEYEKIEVPIAPLEEQKRIADKLDSVLAKVEAAQARLDKIPAILKRFRQSVLAAATSGELTRDWREEHGVSIDDWKQSTLSEVSICLDPNPSHRYPKADSSGVPILSTQQFVGLDSWTTDKSKLVSRDFFLERREKTKFLEDDIIFARKGRLGLARMAPKGFDYVYSHTVFIVRARKINKEYLLWLLRQEQTVNWLLKEMNSNTGVPTLGKAIFEKLPVPLPCEKEQVTIVDKVSGLFEHAETIEKQYNAAKVRLEKLTQSILAKAFRGELVS
ncbi:restriction endonuclease subunit S [Alteromonas sp. H39]|uniref:restriction endonuclease subunit S n=1 Tax=Alteromonas sp. H39 TaxID=3389876 RepID=UPI0039E05B46